MDVQVEDLSPVEKKLSFTVPADKVDEELATAYKTLRRDVMLPGFRPGKVPRKMLEQRFGGQIGSEVASKLISDAFDEAIEKNDLTPVSAPNIDQQDLKLGQPFAFSITVEIKPDVVVKDYDGIQIVWPTAVVEDGEAEEQIESMRTQSGSLALVEEKRPAADGDTVDVTFTLAADGQEDLVREHVLVGLPEDTYHGFLVDMIRGLSAGETKEETLSIPADYVFQDWAGKDAKTTLEVHELKMVHYPELNDDFAKDMGHDTVDAMNQAVRFSIQEAKDQRNRDQAARSLIEKVIDSNAFEIPPRLIEHRGESLMTQIASQMMPGMQELPEFKLDQLEDDRKESLLKEAEFSVRRELILEAVVKQEELKVTDEERDAKIESISTETGQRAETVRGYLLKGNGMKDLETRMLDDKALDLMLERAEIVEEEPAAEEPAAEEATAKPAAEEPAAEEPAAEEPAAEEATAKPAAEEATAKPAKGDEE